MIEIIKDGVIYIFCQDKNTHIQPILEKYSILKKDRTPYKSAVIDNNHMFYLDGTQYTCNSIKYKNTHILIFNDVYDFEIDSIGKLGMIIKDFTPICDKISFGGFDFGGRFDKVEDNLIKDDSGVFIGVNSPKQNSDELSSFIFRMKKDNAQIISPLVKRFAKSAFVIRDKRSIMGYAHLPTYFRILKHGFNEKFMYETDIDPRVDYLIDASSSYKGKLIMGEGGVLTIHFSNGTKPYRKPINSKKSADPYLLISTQPININGNKLPFFTSIFEHKPIFISILLFSDNSILKNMKGGLDLLKIN